MHGIHWRAVKIEMPQGTGVNGKAASVEMVLLTHARAHQLQRQSANPVIQSCWRKGELKGWLLHREVQIYPNFHCIGEKNPFSTVTDANKEIYQQGELVPGSGSGHHRSRSVWSAPRKVCACIEGFLQGLEGVPLPCSHPSAITLSSTRVAQSRLWNGCRSISACSWLQRQCFFFTLENPSEFEFVF